MSTGATVAGDGPPLLAVADLVRAGHALAAPFRLALREPDAVLTCERVLRLLPGRRLVAHARIDGAPVLLKLFFGRGAARYARREARGCALLRSAGVPAPALLGQAVTADGAGHALVFELLSGARPLDAGDTPGLALAAAALARLHAAGCVHADLHLDNFLVAAVTGVELWLVDADGIRRDRLARGAGVGRRAGLRNLAVLCAQRAPGADAELEAIHRAYARARGWDSTAPGFDLAALRAATARERGRRIDRYLRKTVRPCSEYQVERGAGSTRICVRAFRDSVLQDLVADPEAAMRRGRMLKDGNSATVVRTELAGRAWIVKRYNVKSLWQRIRRSLQAHPRHRNAWRNGQRLHFLGIPTARPVALLERRHGPLRGVAYLVMEDLGDRDLLGALRTETPDDALVASVVAVFATLDALQLAHGDTKATNFLRVGRGVALVDLDAMAQDGRAKRRVARDRARFLANWGDRPAVRERFAAALRAAGLAV
jgi:tRNA A-37 threonylcarbamoyl transferase component Bud32